jgi:hypothetical protein
MTLKIVGAGLVAMGLALLIVAILWRLYLKRHDEQILATRVMRACHEIGTPVTAAQVLEHIRKEHRFEATLADVRILLECMTAEGTLSTERDYRGTGRPGGMAHVRVYTLTPRFAAGFQ